MREQFEAWTSEDAVSSDVTPAGTLRAKFVLRDNFRYRRTIERTYLRVIGAARREILICNAFFLPSSNFRAELIAAAGRGVRVRVMLPGRAEYRIQRHGAMALYDELLCGGIEIIEYRKSLLHAKVAVVDDWATVGSSNIDPFSLLTAREANLVVEDAAFAAELRSRIEHAIADGGVIIHIRTHDRRGWRTRLMNRVAYWTLRAGVALSGSTVRY